MSALGWTAVLEGRVHLEQIIRCFGYGIRFSNSLKRRTGALEGNGGFRLEVRENVDHDVLRVAMAVFRITSEV